MSKIQQFISIQSTNFLCFLFYVQYKIGSLSQRKVIFKPWPGMPWLSFPQYKRFLGKRELLFLNGSKPWNQFLPHDKDVSEDVVEHVGPLDLDCDPAVVLGVLQLELVHLTERGSCDRFSFGVEVQENLIHSFTAKQTIVTIVYSSEKYFLSFQLDYCTLYFKKKVDYFS